MFAGKSFTPFRNSNKNNSIYTAFTPIKWLQPNLLVHKKNFHMDARQLVEWQLKLTTGQIDKRSSLQLIEMTTRPCNNWPQNNCSKRRLVAHLTSCSYDTLPTSCRFNEPSFNQLSQTPFTPFRNGDKNNSTCICIQKLITPTLNF